MLTVYFNETQYHKWTWDEVFLELTLYLKDKYDAKVVHHKGADGINLYLHIDELNFDMPNCVLIIHNSEDGSLTGITFEDNPGEVVNLFIERNRPDDKLLVFQFSNKWPSNFDRSTYNFKILQGVHYTHSPKTNPDYYYNERRLHVLLNKPFIEKMFYLGREDRGTISELRKLDLVTEFIPGSTNDFYMEQLIKYKLGIGIPGVGEMCCREFECMAAGVPVIKFEFITQLNPPLIPNFHYIAISREKYGIPEDCHLDQRGTEAHTQGFIDRFNEVKNDEEFLRFIAKNGREYYETYCHPSTRLKHLTGILGL
jgi:hypothetical protein